MDVQLAREQAYDNGILLSFSHVAPALRMVSDFMFQPERAEIVQGFELEMPADRAHFRGWDPHNALRGIAPFVADTHGFVYDWNTGGYLDEITVTDGRLTLLRRHTGFRHSSRVRLHLLTERSRLPPDDHLLTEAIAREIGLRDQLGRDL